MAREPTDWASAGVTAKPPNPLSHLPGDAWSSDQANVAALFDKTTRTDVTFNSEKPTVVYTVEGALRPLRIYTLTSGGRNGDPRSWALESSDDREHWTVLDERHDQVFRWRRQTRPFAIEHPAAHPYYRLRITEGGDAEHLSLAQWELLAETR